MFFFFARFLSSCTEANILPQKNCHMKFTCGSRVKGPICHPECSAGISRS